MKWPLRLPNLSARQRAVLRWTGYPLFYLFCLSLFFRWTFPYDRLKQTVIAEFSKGQAGPNPLRLEIDSLSSYGLLGFGAKATGIHLSGGAFAKPGAALPKAGATASAPVSTAVPAAEATTIESLGVSVSLLGLLLGRTNVKFSADAFGGEVRGSVKDSSAARDLQVTLADLDLGQVPMLGGVVGLPLGGTLQGRLELAAPERSTLQSEGTLSLLAQGITVGDGKAKIRDTIALPRLNAESLTIEGSIKRGRLTFEKFALTGGDLELEALGTLDLREPFSQSLVNLQLEFRFSDRYKSKSDLTRGLFGDPKTKAPGAFDLDPQNRRARNEATGGYGWRITGTAGNLTTQPEAGALTAARAATSRPKAR
jgi:type II secretion system protein N